MRRRPAGPLVERAAREEDSVLPKRLCRFMLRSAGWKLVGEVPKSGVLIGAPHTSYWDFLLMLLVMGAGGVAPVILIKEEAFVGPIGWFLRRIGGIPVNRRNPAGMVRSLVQRLDADKSAALVIAPEGTRSKGEYWKSGFYRIAKRADLPVVLGFIDGPVKHTGFGPTITLTGDVRADMDQIRAFYADKRGLRPAWRTEPRLKEEQS